MIIADEDDTQKIKDPPVAVPTVRYPERAAGRRPFSPLPDYETSQALAFRDFNESQVTLYKPPPRRRFFDSRVWRVVFASLVVYLFFSLVIGVPIIVHKYNNGSEERYPYGPLSYAFAWPNKDSGPYAGNASDTSNPVQLGIVPVCGNWSTLEYLNSSAVLATTERYVSQYGQFTFTSNASSFLDFQYTQGVFYAGINPDQSVQDAVLFVEMQSSSSDLFDRCSVCFAVAENFTDLLLAVPDDPSPSDNVLYNITLLFPQNAVPYQVDSFATFLPMFDQRFDSFDGNVNFGTVSIEGAGSPVTVDSLRADRILVDTALEPITGTFHVKSSLLMSTIMAPIVANVSLYNDPKCSFPTTLDVHTGNSNLTVDVIVRAPNISDKESLMRPNFIANLRTFSGSLSTNVWHDPSSPPTAIQLHALNDLGPANVTLDSLYEGVFQVSTKQAIVSVAQGNATVPGPGTPGVRTMNMAMNSTWRSYGWIGWEQGGAPSNGYPQGEVLVDTSRANATLSFLG